MPKESKSYENKQIKKENLLSAAYSLFIRKGVNDTSISDITDTAGVAKGTFYLYFIDKWDIYEKLIIEKSYLLFEEALIYVNNQNIKNFDDKIINMFDYIINYFNTNTESLKFIGRNLSLGIYNNLIVNEYDTQYNNIKETLENELKKYNKKIKNASSIIFMLIELLSSTCYDVITKSIDVNIDDYKKELYNEIKKMIN